MNKLIISIIIVLLNHSMVFADTTLYFNPLAPDFDECPSEPWTNDWAWPRTMYWVPSSNSLSVPPSGSTSCTSHYYYTSADQTISFTNNGWITSCWAWKRYVNSSLSCIWSTCTMICREYDDTRPDYTTDVIDLVPDDLLADDTTNYTFEINNLGVAPIISVIAQKEDHLTWLLGPTFSMLCTNTLWISTCYDTWNTSLVDNDRDTSGGRDYTFRIIMICDEAWNCWNWPINRIHKVYSDTLHMSWSIINNDLIDPSNISDWSIKNLTFKLEDPYLNDIIPASWISRSIDFTYDADNSVYLNQYARVWNWVYISTPSNSSFLPLIPIWTWGITLYNQNSNNGIYNFRFKVYTPTRESYYKSDNSLHFLGVRASVTDGIGLWNYSNYNLNSSSFSLRSLPIYHTLFSWSLVSDWFIEWTVQDWKIEIHKNWTGLTSSNTLYFEFWSGDTNAINSKLNLRVWATDTTVINPIWEWNPNFSTYINNFVLWDVNFYTKLFLQTWATLDDIQNSYFSSHIWYEILWPNWGTINPIYNSDVYWKNYYWWTIWSGNTYASSVKVIGQTYSKKFNEIISWQSWNQVKLLNWDITKSSLKTEVRKNAYNIIRNTPLSNSWNTIINSNFALNPDWAKLLGDSILYFGWLNWNNVILNSLTFDWNKTILVEWWNLYINWNINISWTKSLLSIVVLKDTNWNWWNIYINPNVTYVKAVMYADKSLISYDWTNELDWNTSFSVLKNQLYIYGSVFSENTVWWSRANPIECPYYVPSCPTQEYAQKFDLNYLRRYYLKDTNYDWIWDTPVWWWISYFPNTSLNYRYPVVIEYNPLIQSNPPLIFRENK